MKKLILIGIMLLMFNGTVLAANVASVQIKNSDKKQVMDAVVKHMVENGYNIMTANDYQIVFKTDLKGFVPTLFFGTRFNGTPEMRVYINFVQMNQDLTLTGESKIISNPNSGYEKATAGDYQTVQPILDEIRFKFNGGYRLGFYFNTKKTDGCYKVVGVLKNSGVEKAGIKIDDEVESVNGESVKSMSYKDFAAHCTMAENASLTVGIKGRGEFVIINMFVPGEYQNSSK